MKIGIAGFSGSGKTTVFHWLTGDAPDPSRSQQGQVGNPAVPDPRLAYLSSLFNPKKTTPTRMELLDTPGLHPTERRDNPRRLAILRDANGLMIVLDGYTSTSSLTDELRRFREEMMLADSSRSSPSACNSGLGSSASDAAGCLPSMAASEWRPLFHIGRRSISSRKRRNSSVRLLVLVYPSRTIINPLASRRMARRRGLSRRSSDAGQGCRAAPCESAWSSWD